MRRLRVGRIVERMRGGDHLDLRIALQFAHEPIDQLRIDQRLVALDVDDVSELLRSFARDFRDAVGAAGMVAPTSGDFRAPVERGFGDAHVVGRDDDADRGSSRGGSVPRHVGAAVCRR